MYPLVDFSKSATLCMSFQYKKLQQIEFREITCVSTLFDVKTPGTSIVCPSGETVTNPIQVTCDFTFLLIIYEMKPTSLSEALVLKAKERAEKEKHARLNAEKLQLEMKMKAEKKRQERLLKEQRLLDEEKLRAQREEERLRKEREAKTQNYFVINQYNRKVPAPDEPVYYGDMVKKFGSWVPHGKGQFSLNEKVKMEGDYYKGDFMSGTIHYENGYSWNGLVLDYKMHGVGVVTKHTLIEKIDSDDEDQGEDEMDTRIKIKREVVYSPLDISRAAVAFENHIICYQDGNTHRFTFIED